MTGRAEGGSASFAEADAGVAPCPYHGKPPGWIAIELLAEDGSGVADARYRIVLPDGEERRGRLDARGSAFVGGFPEGTCKVGFPDLDRTVWSALAPREGGSVPSLAEAQVPADLQQPERRHVVQQGECISSLTERTGHLWRTLWEHAENVELRSARDNPDILSPGDVIVVPELRHQEASCPTGASYRFRRHEAQARFRLALRDSRGTPLASLDYLLDIDGMLQRGALDSDGKIDVPIAPDARRGSLEVYDAERSLVAQIRFELGHMDPITTERGVAARLRSLGFGDCENAEELEGAIAHFQERYLGPDHVTGRADGPTTDKLAELYDAPA